MTEWTAFGETGYTLLHVTQDGSPLTRTSGCGARWPTPTTTQADHRPIDAGVPPIANGPFSQDQVGYLEDTGYPQAQDMETAKALIAEYKAEQPGPLNLSLATTQDETNLIIAQFQKQWFEEAGVDNVHDRPDRPGATTSSPPCRATSRSSSGATTAASTWTSSTSGGTPRPRCPSVSWRSTSAASRTT